MRPYGVLLASTVGVLLMGAAAPPPMAGDWRLERNGAAECVYTFTGVRSGAVRMRCGAKFSTARWTLRGRQLVLRTPKGEYLMRYDRADGAGFHAELYSEGGRRYLDLIREGP